MTEEKRDGVRLDWKGEEPPSNMHDGRPAASLLGLGLEWAELDLLRETLSASAHMAGKHVGTLEFFDAFSHSRRKLAYFESETSQKAYLGENKSTPSDVRQMSRESVTSDWKDEKADGAVDRSHTSHLHFSKMVQHPCQ